MKEWFIRMDPQIDSLVTNNIKDDFPPLLNLFKWTDFLVEEANALYEDNLGEGQSQGVEFAEKAHDALVACMVIGRYFPPLRLSIVRTLVHPSMANRRWGVRRRMTVCLDNDCNDPKCKGNRLEVFKKEGESDERVRLVAPHHKNDRRGVRAIKFTLPSGTFTTLILRYIKSGHQVGSADSAHMGSHSSDLISHL